MLVRGCGCQPGEPPAHQLLTSATSTCDRRNQHREPEPGTGGTAHAVKAAVTQRHLAAPLQPSHRPAHPEALGERQLCSYNQPSSLVSGKERKSKKREKYCLCTLQRTGQGLYTQPGKSKREQEPAGVAQGAGAGHGGESVGTGQEQAAASEQLLFKLKATHTHKCFASHSMALSTQAGALTI